VGGGGEGCEGEKGVPWWRRGSAGGGAGELVMHRPCPGARPRRRQGGAEMPTRPASSTLVMRPSSCSSRRIWRSMASRRAATGGSGSGVICDVISGVAGGAKEYCSKLGKYYRLQARPDHPVGGLVCISFIPARQPLIW